MQAEAGYLSLTGEPDGPPARMGLSIVDLMTGLFAAFALVSGVLAARESGRGRDLDVSLFDTALQILCERLGRPEWAEDPRFRRFADRLANRELINRLLDEALSARTTEAWLAHFAGQVPAAPVNDLRQALDNRSSPSAAASPNTARCAWSEARSS